VLSEGTSPVHGRLVQIENGLLLLIAPFLIFPTLLVEATFLSLVLVILVWLLPLAKKPRIILPRTPLNLALLAWVVFLLVGILVTADPDLTLPKAAGLILGMTVWLQLARNLRSQPWLRSYLLAFALMGAGFLAFGAMTAGWLDKIPALARLAALLPSLPVELPESISGDVHPNQIAGTIMMLLPLPLSALLAGRRGPRGWGWMAVMALLSLLSAGLLALTQSRSGWLGGVGGLLALLILWGMVLPASKKRRALWLVTVTLMLLGVVAILLIGPARLQELWRDPQQETAVGNLSTLSFRQEVWRWSIMAIGDFPFTGMGLGSFRRVIRRLYPLAVSPSFEVAHAHNLYLQVALDVGLPGFIAYLVLVMIAGAMGWEAAKRDEGMRPVALGLLAGLIALHVYGVSDALALGSKSGILFWMILGLLTGMRTMVHRPSGGDGTGQMGKVADHGAGILAGSAAALDPDL
jgi:putative inorganic carbon (HCO3(-)) transporter